MLVILNFFPFSSYVIIPMHSTTSTNSPIVERTRTAVARVIEIVHEDPDK